MAGGLSNSPLWPRTRLPTARLAASGVRQVSLPGVTDCRHGVSSNEAPVDGVVLGGLFDGDRQARHIGTVALATDGHPIRNGLAAPAQARRAMVNAAGEPLHGEIEIDETWVGGPQPGLRGSRQLKGRKAVLVAVAVEKRANRTGRARMTVIPDFQATTLLAFIKENISPGSTIYTDGLKQFTGLEEAGYQHVPRAQPLRADLRKGTKPVVPLADRAIGNLQQWLIGTYHGVGRHQLQVYLDEFVFRHNRRKTPQAAFQTLLGLGTAHGPTEGDVIRGGHDLPQFPIRS